MELTDSKLGVVHVVQRGTCRECGDPAWTKDPAGFVHLCCAREGKDCPACSASKSHARKQAERIADRDDRREERRRGRGS